VHSDLRCPSGKIIILWRYYIIFDPKDQTPHAAKELRLEVRLTPICIDDPLAEVITSSLTIPAAQDGAARVTLMSLGSEVERHRLLKRIRETTVEYEVDRLDKSLLGDESDRLLWDADHPFSFVGDANLIEYVNNRVNGVLSEEFQKAANQEIRRVTGQLSVSSEAVMVSSDIAASLVLASVERPIKKTIKAIELAGIAVGLLTGNPALVAACAKPLAHQAFKDVISQTVNNMVSSLDNIARAKSVNAGRAQKEIKDPDDRVWALRQLQKIEEHDARSDLGQIRPPGGTPGALDQ
jgi:hypothetical protein